MILIQFRQPLKYLILLSIFPLKSILSLLINNRSISYGQWKSVHFRIHIRHRINFRIRICNETQLPPLIVIVGYEM